MSSDAASKRKAPKRRAASGAASTGAVSSDVAPKRKASKRGASSDAASSDAASPGGGGGHDPAGWPELEYEPAPPTKTAIGDAAELLAIAALRAEGYEIEATKFRCKIGELDIVARDRGILVFVEVRSRADDEFGHAALMVGRRKQRKVIDVATYYLATVRPEFDECRFDVVAITGGVLDLIQDAFRA